MLLALMGIDCILVLYALQLAINARLGFGSLGSYIALPQAFARIALVILVCELSLYSNDLYDFRSRRGEILVRLLRGFGVACLVLAGIYYLVPNLSLGRGIATVALLLALVLTLGWRAMVAQRPLVV
jgi:hypothetical protein